MPEAQLWALPVALVAFVAAALVIGGAGVLMTARAERLAQVTGLGQAIMGAVFIGASTSLSGLSTTVAAAFAGHAELAISNAVGGIAAQTAFLGIADLSYRRANLEHAAASESNLMQGTLLIVLLATSLLAMLGPEIAWFGVHPVSLALFGVYYLGTRMISRARDTPMWYPRRTRDTQPAERDEQPSGGESIVRLWAVFALLALAVAVSGWVIARAGVAISHHLGVSQTVIGTLFTAVATSLPELVIAVSAVRRGALTLAVGDIIGGNAFDVLFLAAADIAFLGGSIYHRVSGDQAFWLALSVLLTAILLLGLLRRERHGIANIGFESFFVLLLYLLGLAVLFRGG